MRSFLKIWRLLVQLNLALILLLGHQFMFVAVAVHHVRVVALVVSAALVVGAALAKVVVAAVVVANSKYEPDIAIKQIYGITSLELG